MPDRGCCVKVRKVFEELLPRAQELHANFSETETWMSWINVSDRAVLPNRDIRIFSSRRNPSGKEEQSRAGTRKG
jgi:hypothetical protein